MGEYLRCDVTQNPATDDCLYVQQVKELEKQVNKMDGLYKHAAKKAEAAEAKLDEIRASCHHVCGQNIFVMVNDVLAILNRGKIAK